MYIQWLPNQLEAVLKQMVEAVAVAGEQGRLGEIAETVRSQQISLRKEVEKYRTERSVVA